MSAPGIDRKTEARRRVVLATRGKVLGFKASPAVADETYHGVEVGTISKVAHTFQKPCSIS